MNNSLSKNSAKVGRVITNAPRRLVNRLRFLSALAFCAQLHAQSTTGIYVNPSNNVGIGTTSPATNLQVGSGTFPVVALPGIGIANGPSSYSFFSASDNTHQYIAGIDNTLSYGKEGMVSNHDLAIETNNAPRIYITNAGNIGIGTTNPRDTLDVTGDVAMGRNGGSTWYFQTPASDLRIVSATNTANFCIIPNGGNVGIGTTTPSAKLDINGTTRAEGGVSLPNNAWISADDTAGASHLIVGVYGNNFIGFGDVTNKFGNGVLFAANQQFQWFVNGNQVATLDSGGNLHANSFIASSGQQYADFVFKPGYKLEPLSAVEASIQKDGHLPGIPSEAEAKAHGIDLASMQVKLLQKIEELTLHQIDEEKRIDLLEKENAELRKAINP
jgi:hypothetical protein